MWQHVGLVLFVQDDTLIHLSTSRQTSTDLRVEEEMMERHQFWVYNTVLQNTTRGTRRTRRFLRAVTSLDMLERYGLLMLSEPEGA